MSQKPNFDVVEAHRYFSAGCFNGTWDLLKKPSRTPEEDRLMVALSFASVYHWMHRVDCTPKNLSIGYWQLSRVHASLKLAVEARRYAETCLSYSAELEPFYHGYAYEALARAEFLAGNPDIARQHLQKAQGFAEHIKDDAEKQILLKDLAGLKA